MFLLKSICLVLVAISVANGADSSEEFQNLIEHPLGQIFVQMAVREAYQKDKLAIISSMVENMQSENANITLVATENVYAPEGGIKEIRSIELHLPLVTKESTDVATSTDDDEDDETFEEIRGIFEVTSKLGFGLEVHAREYDSEGTLEELYYITHNKVFGYSGGIYTGNVTIEVEDSSLVKPATPDSRRFVSTLKYGADYKFLPKESTIDANLLTMIDNVEGDVSQDLLDSAQEGLATAFLEYPEDHSQITAELVEHLRTKHPEYDFFAFHNDVDSYYINKDIKIDLHYDFTFIVDPEKHKYSIYGYKVPKPEAEEAAE